MVDNASTGFGGAGTANAADRIPTALTDRELESFGPPDPRILVCGCGGSGNNTMNRITHIGVEGAITVAINTDKQHLDHTRAQQKLLLADTLLEDLVPVATQSQDVDVQKQDETSLHELSTVPIWYS